MKKSYKYRLSKVSKRPDSDYEDVVYAESASDSDTASDATLGPESPVLSNETTDQFSRSKQRKNNVDMNSVEHSTARQDNWTRDEENIMVRLDTPSQNSDLEEGAGSVRQLKDLLTRLSPMISLAGTSETTPQMLMFLSDTDPKFHTLQLVKSMRADARSELESTIDILVKQQLDVARPKIKDENPVVSVLNTLFQEQTFLQFMESFQNTLMESCDYLHRNFDSEMISVLQGFYHSKNMQTDNMMIDSSSNNSSLNSSLNQSGFLFLSPRQYETIASILTNKQMMSKWVESLNQLLSVTPGEPVIQQSWFNIKKGLQNALQVSFTHQNPQYNIQEIFMKSLQMHSKLLASQTQSAVTEALINLIDAASEFWFSKKLVSGVPRKNKEFLDLQESSPILHIMKLILSFQKDLPLLWVRYPAHLTIKLIEKWFNFLVELTDKANHISSLGIVCLLDPEASWLRYWLHTRYSRTHVFAAMSRTQALLTHALRFCFQTIMTENETILDSEEDKIENGRFSLNHYDQIKFLYCVNFVLEIIKYHEGRQLFPLRIDDKEQSLTVEKTLMLLYSVKNNSATIQFFNTVAQKLRDLCTENAQMADIICNSELLQQYVGDLFDDRHKMNRKSVSLCLACLQSLMATDRGLTHILLGSVENGCNFLQVTPDCNQLLELFGRLLVEEHQLGSNYSVTFGMTTTVLDSCVGRYLYASHTTFQQMLTNLTHLHHCT